MAYIASFIRENGYDVTIYDINVHRGNREDVVSRLAEYDFDYVGISALVDRFSYVKWLAKEIEQIKDVPITVGYGLGTGTYGVVLKNIPEIDFCVLGEGEETFLEILNNPNTPEAITGIAYRDETGKVVVNPERNYKVEVNDLPWPAYDLFEMDKYFVESTEFLDTGYFSVRGEEKYRRIIAYMITARGCPYNCKFCGRIIPKVRMRDIKEVIKEVEYLKETYGVTGITFYDELLTLNKKRTLKLAEALHRMDILWSCQGRVDRVDIDFLKKIKEYGCVSLGYGIESGSDKILKEMDKKATVEQVENAMKAAEEAGLEIKIQLIFGYPGEDKQTANETIQLFKKLKSPGRRFNVIRPLPGSRLYDELLEQGIIIDEFEYIRDLEISIDMNIPIVNLTGFKDNEIKLMSTRVEGLLLLNYLIYMIVHRPLELLNKFRRSKGSLRAVVICLARLAFTYLKPLYNFKQNIDVTRRARMYGAMYNLKRDIKSYRIYSKQTKQS